MNKEINICEEEVSLQRIDDVNELEKKGELLTGNLHECQKG